MRLSAASAFLQSRIGRRLFAAFFVLVAVPVAAVSLLAYQLTDYIVRQSAVQLSSEMTKAVALNLIDRLRLGFVVDFVDVHWKDVYHWPAFNVADSCIVIGVGILFLESFRAPKTVESKA